MHVLLSIILIALVVRKGKWRNIEKYHLTILYVITCNLLYNVLCKDKLLWQYKPDFLPNSHVIVDLLYTFINLPAVTFLYLHSYPYSKPFLRQAGYICVWVLVSLIVELPFYSLHRLYLRNGYEYWMEPMFYIAMYSLIRLHHTKRLLTYALSVMVTIVLLFLFRIPLQ
jgi:hypothetical protein